MLTVRSLSSNVGWDGDNFARDAVERHSDLPFGERESKSRARSISKMGHRGRKRSAISPEPRKAVWDGTVARPRGVGTAELRTPRTARTEWAFWRGKPS